MKNSNRLSKIILIILSFIVLIYPVNSQTADDWLYEGNLLYNNGEFNNAIAAYDKAIALDPNSKDAWLNKGVALYGMGDYESAVEALDISITNDPSIGEARGLRDSALSKLAEQTAPTTMEDQKFILIGGLVIFILIGIIAYRNRNKNESKYNVIILIGLLLVSGCLQQQTPQPLPVPAQTPQISSQEKADIAEAETYRASLNERIVNEQTDWRRLEEDYITGIEKINATDITTYTKKPINAAEKEKKRYDKLKLYNLKLYDIELDKLREQIVRLEILSTHQYNYNMEKAKKTESFLEIYRTNYEIVKSFKEQEINKVFDLPVQGTDLHKFNPGDIGNYDSYAVRYGKGPELANPEDIKKLGVLNRLAAEYFTSVGI